MYTIVQFCEVAKISRRLFDVLKAQGRGPHLTRVGRHIFISQETAKEWIEGRGA
jgi:hypothetical protein